MAACHYTITMTGSAQNLATVLKTALGVNFPGINNKLRFLSIQAAPANAAVAYVGGVQRTLTNADYGYRIEIPVTNIPYAPTVIETGPGVIALGDIQVLGTNNEKLHILIGY